jgi:hypothetical protein
MNPISSPAASIAAQHLKQDVITFLNIRQRINELPGCLKDAVAEVLDTWDEADHDEKTMAVHTLMEALA